MTSAELEKELGGFLKEQSGLKVDLENPEFRIYVEWMKSNVFVYGNKIQASGGLPIGTGGEVLCLLSGGIDSPVASYCMMKRGCSPLFIHFHSFPFTDKVSQRKVVDLARMLCRYRCESKIYLVPFADLQKEIVVSSPAAYRVVLYRRIMFKIAQEVAFLEKAKALVTGESLSQVASQTLSNLCTIQSCVSLPVLRPLIAMDKKEIVHIARRIGTFPLSIEPHGDCCSFLLPRHPKTRSSRNLLENIEKKMEMEGLIKKSLGEMTCESLR